MKTCNECIHASCCHYLLQEDRGYDEYNEQYYNDMETRCKDFKDKKQFIPVDISALLKLRKKIENQIKKLETQRNKLEKKESILFPHGFHLSDYEHAELVYIQGQISSLKGELEDLDKIFPWKGGEDK